MIIGSGLIANAFGPHFSNSAEWCVYAAGVSNSKCMDRREFDRERVRLAKAIQHHRAADLFLYFGTCSVYDPRARSSPYVRHKIEMERIVAKHSRHLILRLPQVAGVTPNPHTLLNFLFGRISRSEMFVVWANARRNIIDVTDVARIAACLAIEEKVRGACINIANSSDVAMPDLVDLFSKVIGKNALCDYLGLGDAYNIDTTPILGVLQRCNVNFGPSYLEQTLRKYYE